VNFPPAMNRLDQDSSLESSEYALSLSSDDEDYISFEEMSDATTQSSPPETDVDFPLFDDDSENSGPLEYFDEQDDLISDSEYNYIKSEELGEGTSSSQCIDISSLSHSDNSSQTESSSPLTLPPESDSLNNLPYEIVDRPRYSS